MSTNEFVIVPRGPFSLARAADVVAHFPPMKHQPGLVEGELRIGFVADDTFEPVAVSIRTADYLGVPRVTILGAPERTPLATIRKQVARIFALDVDGTRYPELALRDANVAELMKAHEGLRPVSFTSPWECACWAIISQRITTSQAANIVRALVEAHGVKVDGVGVFPTPQKLLQLTPMPSLPAVKVERLHAMAAAALDGKLDAAELRRLPEAEALARLLALPGIGDFWSRGIWLRACGVHDHFDDGTEERRDLAERYRPFGMWVAFLQRVSSRRSHARPPARRMASTRRPATPAA